MNGNSISCIYPYTPQSNCTLTVADEIGKPFQVIRIIACTISGIGAILAFTLLVLAKKQNVQIAVEHYTKMTICSMAFIIINLNLMGFDTITPSWTMPVFLAIAGGVSISFICGMGKAFF